MYRLLMTTAMLLASTNAALAGPSNTAPNVAPTPAPTPASSAAPKPAGDPVAGAASFHKCASCHQVGPAARAGFGPHLNGIFGRRAGSTQYRYSAAMQRSGIVWNERTLAAFLRAPGDVVPGTKMRFWGIGDERQIANLLAYLRQYPSTGEQ